MYKRWFLILSFFGILCQMYGQLPANCSGQNANKVILAGDSWSQYMADDGTHSAILKAYGHADKVAISQTYEIGILCTGSPSLGDYAVSGSEARQWADEDNHPYLNALINAVNANVYAEWIVLSIGGNDILAGRSEGGWYKNMDLDVLGSEAALFTSISNDIDYIMQEVWSRARPDIKFLISSYDYPNFNVTGSFLGFEMCEQYACPKREDLSRDDNGNGLIDSDELITDAELTSMMLNVENIRQSMADASPLVYYDNGMGLSHYYYGFDDPNYPTFDAGTTAPPQGVSPYAPGGNLNTPTDRENFRTVDVCGIGSFAADPIHLDVESYEYKIKNQMDHVFFNDMRGVPTITVFSDGNTDGYVDIIDNGVYTQGLRMGDEGIFCCWGSADKEYRSIVSFDTSNIPDDATVTGASLYIMRSNADDNPFFHNDRSPKIDMKSGFFNDNSSLEVADGVASADAYNIGCFHGSGDENKYAIRMDITANGLATINKTGFTQLRLYFNYSDWSNEYIDFYDGEGKASFAPNVEEKNASPIFASRKIKKIWNADGTFEEIEIEKGKEIKREKGKVYYEKIISKYENEEGDEIIEKNVVTAIEHAGLAKLMNTQFSAPGNGYAPFLDISYELALPVELDGFTVTLKDHDANISWSTISEYKFDGFSIEHRNQSTDWEHIGWVDAYTNSSVNMQRDYSFVDKNLTAGTHYYRLKMVDQDGSIEYSKIRSVNIKTIENVLVAPNPITSFFDIIYEAGRNQALQIQVYNTMGVEIYTHQWNVSIGVNKYRCDKLSSMPNGAYYLKISGSDINFSTKIVK